MNQSCSAVTACYSSSISKAISNHHIQSASATRWGRYDVSNMERLKGGEFKTIHAGFDPAAADADPNVITPIDALKVLEKEGVYGSLHPYFYTTVGTGTTEAEAARMAKEIIPYLQEDHVDGVIMEIGRASCRERV